MASLLEILSNLNTPRGQTPNVDLGRITVKKPVDTTLEQIQTATAPPPIPVSPHHKL